MYRNITVASWRELRTVLEEHRGWAFRGQSQADWSLYCTLSRYFISFDLHKEALPLQEERIFRIFKRKAMEELYNMNIMNATLFPGLGGLARSLAYELEYHWKFDPITMQRKKGF